MVKNQSFTDPADKIKVEAEKEKQFDEMNKLDIKSLSFADLQKIPKNY